MMRQHAANPLPLPGRRGMTLVEVLLALALSATVMVAVGYAFTSVADAYRTNRSTIMAGYSERSALDYLVAQIRRADACTDAGSSLPTGDAEYPAETTEITLTFGGGAARPDCQPADRMELHVRRTELDGGRSGLRIWKLTPAGTTWNGATFSSSDYFDIPGAVEARIRYNGSAGDIKSVELTMMAETRGPDGRALISKRVVAATVRR